MIVFEEFVYISRKNFNLNVFLLHYSLGTPPSAASKKSLKFRNYFTDNVVIKSYDKKNDFAIPDWFYDKLAPKPIIQGLRVDWVAS